jgi:hypothetical protein
MAREPIRALPARPSKEHLRKQAKRLAKETSSGLAEAQRRLAAEYGFKDWAALMIAVDAARGGGTVAEGTPLWRACMSDAPDAERIATVEALLAAGANPRAETMGETALHAAARKGPLALVEALLRGEALEWQPDKNGKPALETARAGAAADKDAIVELLARPVIRDASFKAAVAAVQQGDVATLGRLLDAEPRLLKERIVEPEVYRQAKRQQYFRDPKLFWFIANNPTLVPKLPPNMVEVARAMIARGVDKADLDYALELVMTNNEAREQGLQAPLVELLLAAGAAPTTRAIEMTLGHRETEAIEGLLAAGHKLTLPIAAALGRVDRLGDLLPGAAPEDIQTAFGLAAINDHVGAVRRLLEAGADPNAFLPVHSHSLALHNAVLNDNVELMELLLAHGARTDIPDKAWNSTPLGWAKHQNKPKAQAFLEKL